MKHIFLLCALDGPPSDRLCAIAQGLYDHFVPYDTIASDEIGSLWWRVRADIGREDAVILVYDNGVDVHKSWHGESQLPSSQELEAAATKNDITQEPT